MNSMRPFLVESLLMFASGLVLGVCLERSQTFQKIQVQTQESINQLAQLPPKRTKSIEYCDGKLILNLNKK